MTDTLAAALVAFQHDAPVIPKNKTARAGSFSYKYADLADVWAALREPLHRHNLAVTQVLSGTGGDILGVRTRVWHTSGETYEATLEVSIAGRTPQEIGSMTSYIRRYALTSALGLSVDEDTDAAGVPAPNPADARTRLLAACRKHGLNPTEIGQRFLAEHGLHVDDADADTITAFTETL